MREAAAFFPAATRFGDFRVVLLRADVRLREAAAFFPAATRFGDFRVVLLRADVRLREAAAFFPAATRFGDFRVVLLRRAGLVDAVFLAAVRFRVAAFVLAAVAALRAAVDLRVRVVAGSVAARSIGPPKGIAVLSDRGVGRSHAGVAGSQDGSGALGAPSALSSRSFLCSELSDVDSSVSFHCGRSWDPSPIVRSSDDGMTNLLYSGVS